jgi:hypothetical protein
MPREIKWAENLPNCDFCSMNGITTPAPYDGKTVHGPWANMCNYHLHSDGFPNSDGLTNIRIKPEGG